MVPRKENGGSASGSIRSSEDRCEQSQADHELFLQAFEKPTQIYRYLKIRNKLSPTFLHRNLSFMKQRMSRTNQKRKTFKVDSLLETRKEKGEAEGVQRGAYITITFLGFYDAKRNEKLTPKVKLDLSLINSTHKKRKESSKPHALIPLGAVDVPVNPSESNPPSKAPALSISSYHLDGIQVPGNRSRTSTLVFKLFILHQISQLFVFLFLKKNLNINAVYLYFCSSVQIGRMHETDAVRSAVAELTVTDKHSRLQLTEGEYELIMMYEEQEDKRFSPKKSASWELIDLDNTDKSVCDEFNKFSTNSTLKFRLSWASESAGTLVERPRPLMPRPCFHCIIMVKKKEKKDEGKIEKAPRIVYQFLYNNNSRQLTEAREDLHCPWCGLNCVFLVSLLKHLKLSHQQHRPFIQVSVSVHDICFKPLPDAARIDVSVSDLFDSTYVGNPHDMISQPPGYAFSRNGPVQRTSITIILVFRPKRSPPSLSEFLELEDNENGTFENQRPFVSGHNRLYHDSTTSLPIPPHAIINNQDLEEEDRTDPEWLQIKTSRMIDDFTDVNEGEKEFMKIWNNHVQKYTFVGDVQMPQALKIFIDERAQSIVQKGLFRNFMLHLVNLFEFGVIGSAHVFTVMVKFQNLMRSRGLHHDLRWAGIRSLIPTESGESRKPRKNFSGIFVKSK
ncbi:polycomb protein suz12-B [Eurytemora carolleeae]|uniref:polycomb protein suz12-B n=1 Tax=Eurytemora carolleeae TaxID=1294199 RepID=UPI000C75CFD7|nr:polycomb protein suz12-B [Eurytemora carolleeae]|eukprot:XP_023328013.1 polycomb protein suz12-B-like [Eurytemora affinis]